MAIGRHFGVAVVALSLLFMTQCFVDIGAGGVSDDSVKISDRDDTIGLHGTVQKGPFVVGSSVVVATLNANLTPSGRVYTTQTSNDRGEFDLLLNASLSSGPLSIEAVGYYFNEVLGDLSASPLTLRALYALPRRANQLQTNVNMVTHLTASRIRSLVTARVAFANAVTQAEGELLRELAITDPGFSPTTDGAQMNILGGNNHNNAYLLAISSVMIQTAIARGGAFDATLQEILNTFTLDFADGTLSSSLSTEITAALLALNVQSITNNVTQRFSEIGSTAFVPDMNQILDQDRDGVVNASDNCPLVYNPEQENVGCGTLCDVAMQDPAKCHPYGRCVINQNGEAECNSCIPGYTGDGKTCVVDTYCNNLGYTCGPNADCVPMADSGGYDCACKPGYRGDPKIGCTDINECAAGTDSCNRTAQDCVNTTGSFTCYCKSGYQNQNGTCVDINECLASTPVCDPNAACANQTPGYTCTCNPGYSGPGTSCTDVNECSNGTHNCDLQVSTCENIVGAFNCKNINECQSGAARTHDCSEYATCTDIDCEKDANNSCTSQSAAGFSCGCNAGFGGNGHGKNGCYCDLSGYWATRQLGDSAQQITFPITIDAFQFHVWEISRFEYDGNTLVGYRKGCGQDLWPEVHIGIIDEIYSTYVPIDAYDQEPLVKSYEFSQASITPKNGSFRTPTEVALAGLTLNDPMNDPWPMDHNAISWVDSDNDGELGYTLQAAGTTKATRTHPDQTFAYFPTTVVVPVERRAACWSRGTRIKTHYEIDSVNTSCNVLIGKIVNEKTEGHIRTCTIVPQSQWDNTDIECNRAYWSSSPERCTDSEVTTIDNETHAPGTGGVTVTFKAVKVGSLTDAEPTCPYVRSYNFDQ